MTHGYVVLYPGAMPSTPRIHPAVSPEVIRQYEQLRSGNLQKVLHDWRYTNEPLDHAACEAALPQLPDRIIGAVRIDEITGILNPSVDARNPTFSAAATNILTDKSVDVAVKLVGNNQERGEFEALLAMNSAGVPTVEPLGATLLSVVPFEATIEEIERLGFPVDVPANGHQVDVIVTKRVDAPLLSETLDDPAQIVFETAALLKPLHDAKVGRNQMLQFDHLSQSVAHRLGIHKQETYEALVREGLVTSELTRAVDRIVERLSPIDGSEIMVHGDPARVNIFDTGKGGLVAFDPRGLVYGTAESDIAQVVAAKSITDNGVDAGTARSLIGFAKRANPKLDSNLIYQGVGVMAVMWSGYNIPSTELLEHQPDYPDAMRIQGLAKARKMVETAAPLLTTTRTLGI